MSPRRTRRVPPAIVTLVLLAILLSGCTGIKAGSYTLSQPAGVGAVNLRLTLCTMVITESPPGAACGPPGESGQGQMLATLMVPAGSTTPASFSAVPGPGAAATTFNRSPELTAKMNAAELSLGSVGPPPGFELFGYTSGAIAEAGTQEFTWTIEAGLGLPPGAGGGSYGGPLKATVMMGWRRVTPELPASRPINCEEAKPGETVCGGPEPNGEATLGVSDLKITPPAPITVVPDSKVKLPFVLDFASSAAALPKFSLAVNSKLPGARLSLSGSTFSRGPTEPATNRAPPTTRQAIVQVPAGARLGSYELALTATAGQGGTAAAATTLVVRPKGMARVTAPKRVRARIAWGRGIPVGLAAPIAGTRFSIALTGPGPSGRGRAQLLKKVRKAGKLGTTELRLRIPRAQAEAFLAEGATLRVEAAVNQPGTKRLRRLVRALKLR